MNRYKAKFQNTPKQRYCSFDDLFGGGGAEAATQAGAATTQLNQEAIDEIRRQLGVTTETLTPFIEAGTAAIPGIQEGIEGLQADIPGLEALRESGPRAGLSALDKRLSKIFGTEFFSSLVDERTRAIQGQLAAGGLTRSGTGVSEIAGVPTDIGLAIENQIFNRRTERARDIFGRSKDIFGAKGDILNKVFAQTEQGRGAATDLGTIGASSADAVAQLLQLTGQDQASAILAGQQAESSGAQNLLNTAVSVGSLFFSDPTLKENVEQIGTVCDLNLYQWDWVPETEGTIITACMNIGFMADEVEVIYPEFVMEFAGLKVIDYHKLLDRLDTKRAN